MNIPPPSKFARYFPLEPDLVFLNHGSFGSCPLAVLEKQQELRNRMERQPVQFLVRDLESLLNAARIELANFVGANPDCLVFVLNVTSAANAVLRSLEFEPGDELLTTDHEYNACKNILDFVAKRSDARVVVAPVPFPISNPSEITEALLAAVTNRTRIALVDHVTSQTGMVFPAREIVHALHERGVDTFIDGAHAPGMLPLDLQDLGAAYYGGNCHKWLCSPKGAGFLYVREDKQDSILPTSISHGYNRGATEHSALWNQFFWRGTDDPTAFLCVPESLKFMGELLPGGWKELMKRNHELALWGQTEICNTLGILPPCPPEMVGAVAPVKLPDSTTEDPVTFLYGSPLQDKLLDPYKIEVPIIPWPSRRSRIARLSAQIYNTPEQYIHFAQALKQLL
ncbi:MAG: aminotransferase class V-fold PLP-dependent enzyme [Planctomycetota bacterium]|nr:aminotransferase class V-fold PLP-dependent enzyme [Planctomycetota bacterium]MDA1138457.1 aminotransferase class V-fold PLP-dependent enzyme [Planctomycetota bacterium]